MTHYRVSYYKNLLSSDGHQFKCLQKQFDLPNVETAEKAQEIAHCVRLRAIPRAVSTVRLRSDLECSISSACCCRRIWVFDFQPRL
jgi:hypothetical protein